MYQNENNQYHFNYSQTSGMPGQYYDARTGGEPFRNFDPSHTHVAEARPVQKKKGRAGIAALALVCALVGGIVGGGASWTVAARMGGPVVKETTIQVADSAAAAEGASTVAVINGKKTLTEAQIYAANVDSVVSINVTGNTTNVFGQVVQSASAGSGFILTADGYIVTNYHVIQGGTEVKVTLYNGETYDASLIGGDKDYDIAVIKIDPAEGKSFKPVTLGKSGQLVVGDHVAAIGNPLGELTFSMSEGIASSVNRAINVDGTPFNMIQVTCAINPGNSGGPLLNQYGEVVGVVSAKYSSYASTSVEGLGFAIPIDDVLSMIEDIMTNGYVANKPYLGISSGTMNATMAAQYKYSIDTGVFVYSVEEGSAAETAGLKMGDVITKVDDKEIKSLEDLNAAKKKYSSGDTATLTYYRDGKSQTVEITWGSVPKEQQQPQQQQPAQQTPQYGNGQYGYGLPYGDLFNYFFGNGWGR
ncbi:MAG: trypsin-like peptidase domain-containing protein [Oscillibacter sp.]|nr:trypsin-like peptidase domain-containing protein [Oscillibacter sp.]